MREPRGAVYRVDLWWLDHICISPAELPVDVHHVHFEGYATDILSALDRHEIEVRYRATVSIDSTDPLALNRDRWGISLQVDGERAVVVKNTGVLWVGVLPGTDGPSGEIDFPDARGQMARETTDTLVPRQLGFQALSAWVQGADDRVPGLEWDGYSSRFKRHPRRGGEKRAGDAPGG